MNNKSCYYWDGLNLKKGLYEVNREIREPSEKCKKKREEILKNWPDCFKETLEKGDCITPPPHQNAAKIKQ